MHSLHPALLGKGMDPMIPEHPEKGREKGENPITAHSTAEQKAEGIVLLAVSSLHQTVTRGGAVIGTGLVRRRNVKITLEGAIDAMWADAV